MIKPFLPPDDLPTDELTQYDRRLRRQLDASLTDRFEQRCDPFTKELLSNCEWYITTYTHVVTLVIHCPDSATNWRVLHHVLTLGEPMAQFSQDAKIRIDPPPGRGTPFEIRVDELSIYRHR